MAFSVVDLFCGAGGFSYGFEKAGFTVKAGLDHDEVALRTFRKNHKALPWHVDITKLDAEEIRACFHNVDVVIGSPPCQGVSCANKKRSSADERCKLFFEFVRVVATVKPRMFVMENVQGLLSIDGGLFFEKILSEFNRFGYYCQWKVLNAADYGVPQARKRVFVVGLRFGSGLKFGADGFEFPQPSDVRVSCEEALSDLSENGSDSPLIIDLYACRPLNNYQHLIRSYGGVYNHIITRHCQRVKDTIALVKPGERGGLVLPENLRGKYQRSFVRHPRDRPSFTVESNRRILFHPWFNRVVTVRENARLQSFPDSFIFYGNKGQQYLQVGNAVPPLLAQRIAECVKKALEAVV